MAIKYDKLLKHIREQDGEVRAFNNESELATVVGSYDGELVFIRPNSIYGRDADTNSWDLVRNRIFASVVDMNLVTGYDGEIAVVVGGGAYIWSGTSWGVIGGGSGLGDMLKATYDPTGKNADAFSMGNMVETATKKILTAAERTILSNTTGTNSGDNATNTTSNSYADGKVEDSIVSGHTTIAPSGNAVFNALAGKQPAGTYSTDIHSNIAALNAVTNVNTGDQTSIVGISGTKSEFDAACSNGNFLFSGDITQYTDEMAQDAVGNAVGNGLDYDDATGAISVDESELTTIQTQLNGKAIYHGVEAIGAVSFNNSTHILTVASITYWFNGIKYTTASPITCDIDSFATLTTNTLYEFYFDDATGTLKTRTNGGFNLKTEVPVALVMWNGTAGAVLKERHSHTRNLDWHINAHLTIGTRYHSGLSLIAPTTSNDAALSITGGTLYDEDLINSISNPQTTMRGWRLASAGVYTFADYSLPYIGTSGQPQYLDTDTYALTNVGASDYVCMRVYGTNDIDRPIYVIPTQAATAYNTITLARTETPPSLSGLNISPEMKLLYRFIYKGDGQFQESVDYRQSSSLPAGGTSATSASSVSFIPTGNISAVDVQSAIVELDSEKQATMSKASGAEVDTGTDDAKYVTAKAIEDSKYIKYDSTETLTNKTITDAKTIQSINAQTGTTYTLVLSDASKLITCSNAATQTYTVPPNSSVAFPIGTQIDLIQIGAGKVTLAQGSGVTISSKGGNKSTNGQYVGVSLIKAGTDLWYLVGDLIA